MASAITMPKLIHVSTIKGRTVGNIQCNVFVSTHTTDKNDQHIKLHSLTKDNQLANKNTET